MHTFLNDLRYGARLLLKNPGFACVAISAMAIGIGGNLTIFGFAEELLVSPPRGVADPARVVRAYTNRFSGTLYADYVAYEAQNHTFGAFAAFRIETVALRTAAAPEQLFALSVSGNYFTTLGIPAAIGRPILAEDDQAGTPDVVALTDHFWRRRFGANPSAIGQTLIIDGRPRTIVGVTPRGVTGTMAPLVPDVWIPVTRTARGGTGSVQMIGRLRPGVAIGEAQADLRTLALQSAHARPDTPGRPMITVYQARTLAPELAVPAAIFAGFLLAVVGLVLLIACVNVANLLLARSVARRREIAIRLALGASRVRLVQQLMTESLLLSLLGGISAAAMSVAAARPLSAAASSLPVPFPIALNFVVDWKLLAATVGFSVAATIAFGLVPALQSSKGDVLPALKDGAATAGAARSRLRAALMVSQVALSTLLLVLAGLLVRGVLSARALDRGFIVDGVLTASIDLQSAGYTADSGAVFYNALLDRLDHARGIRAAAIVDVVPLTLSNRVNTMITDGPGGSGGPPMVYKNRISRGHFHTLGIPLLAGRDFDSRDRVGATPVAIVNETLAARFWPGDNPIGKRLRDWNGREPSGPWLEVVGVARDSKYVTLGEDPKAFMYRPVDQEYVPVAFLLVKSAGGPMDAVPRLRAEMEALNPNLPLFGVMTLDAATGISVLPVKIAASLAGGLGLLALALGAIGLYGVMTYLVRQRTREIGIRMALGAQPNGVVRLVTGQGMRWTVIGLMMGLAAAFGVARLIAGFLYGVAPADPVAFAAIVVLLTATAFAACYLPARRASRIDPLEALREN